MGKFKTGSIRNIFWGATLTAFLSLLVSCSGMDPRNVDVELEQSAPEAKITSYSEALSDLGNMSLIFDTGVVKLQCSDIADNTGTSASSGGEIQRNITEIMKSTLNSMGGNIVFIEYDPSFIQNQMVTGYSNFENKVIPDVVITGGITEFDRGLETRETGVDAAATAKFSGVPGWVPSNEVGGNYGNAAKAGKARITLDFNMKDFTTLAGVPKMSTTNSMEVHKATKQKELGITLFGPTFGLKGSVKKVQGRHEAVRLLVQVSMIQMVGKYLAIPYWRLLGDDTEPDPVVLDTIEMTYHSMDTATRIFTAQRWLFMHGYDVTPTGNLDSTTMAAIMKFDPSFPVGSQDIPFDFFSKLYITMPFDAAATGRHAALMNLLNNTPPLAQQAAPVQQAPQQAAQAVAYEEAPAQAAAPEPEPQAAVAPAPDRGPSTGFGRKLKDDEW